MKPKWLPLTEYMCIVLKIHDGSRVTCCKSRVALDPFSKIPSEAYRYLGVSWPESFYISFMMSFVGSGSNM